MNMRIAIRMAVVFLLMGAGLAPRAEATDYTTTQNGNWNANSTWGGAGFPNGAADNAIISAGHTVTVAQAGTSYTVNNLTVNGTLTHTANSTEAATPYYKIDLTIHGALNVAAGGMIDAKAKGFSNMNGPGKSNGGGTYGASHGGLGGNAGVNPTYGSVTNPTTLGSGGGSANQDGGGAVILRVSGSCTLNGIIRADGRDIDMGWREGASGGSVNLAADTLTGSGLLSANGNTNYFANMYNGGGGGRIAVRLASGTDFGNVVMQAFGGPGSTYGAAGTIYRQSGAQPAGQGDLVVDNRGVSSAAATLISTNVTDRQVGTLIITNSGVFAVGTNASFTVTGNVLNYAQTAPLCATGGTFVVGGSGTMTFGGTVTTNRFFNFTCTNAGKRIVFPSGSSNVLDGVLTLQGTAGNEVQLASSGSGSWKLKVPSPFMGSVNFVDVTNSDASAGAAIAAYDSINRGGNVNWSFASVGETNVWTGTSGTNWNTAGNWSLNRLTVPSDVIRITPANSPPNWPALNSDMRVLGLWIESGAQLSLNGKNLTVDTNLVVAGSLIAGGTETVTIKGDANWTGATFTKASSTVVIGGAGAQALDFSGIAFHMLRSQNAGTVTLAGSFSAVGFVNSGGAVSFSHDVTAGSFSSTGGNLTFGGNVTATNFAVTVSGVTLTFHAGSVYAFTNLTLYGSAINRITLVSSSPGSAWNLNVSGMSYVSGVTVSDSDAGGGLTIRPVASAEGMPGSTINWTFAGGSGWKKWIGLTAAFTASNNWSPAGIPDAGSSLMIESTNGIAAPVLTNALTVADLAIGGIGAALLTLQAPLTVSNTVSVLQGGVLTHPENGAVTDPVLSVNLTVGGDLVIAPGGLIDATAKGYADGPAPGNNWQWGGSHGGLGYNTTTNSYTTYGSVTNPILPGSRGSFGSSVNEPGGGVVILRITGDAIVDGAIRANARFSGDTRDAGSGGSVNLTAARLSGAGAISANSNTNSMHGGGGGGRVAVKLTTGTSVGNVVLQALGGVGTYYGAPGTVYLQTGTQAAGQGALIVDAGGYGSAVTTLISTNVTGATVGDVLIRNSASFALASNTAISVAGSWSNAATFTGVSNSVVRLTGSGTAGVYGQNTFGMLAITNTGTRTVYFQAGKTNWVNGALLVRNATLLSTADNTQWHIRLANGATQFVKAVTVKDSNAANGQEIVAQPSSRNLGNNVNWKFIKDFGTVLLVQ